MLQTLVALILAHPQLVAGGLGFLFTALLAVAGAFAAHAKKTRNTIDDRVADGLVTILNAAHPAVEVLAEEVKGAKTEADLKAIGQRAAQTIMQDAIAGVGPAVATAGLAVTPSAAAPAG